MFQGAIITTAPTIANTMTAITIVIITTALTIANMLTALTIAIITIAPTIAGMMTAITIAIVTITIAQRRIRIGATDTMIGVAAPTPGIQIVVRIACSAPPHTVTLTHVWNHTDDTLATTGTATLALIGSAHGATMVRTAIDRVHPPPANGITVIDAH
jgi:hypothetical protein